jgi:hypothetical protein
MLEEEEGIRNSIEEEEGRWKKECYRSTLLKFSNI